MRRILFLCPLLVGGLVIASCDDGGGDSDLPEVDCATATVVGYDNVRIFDFSCLQCHASDVTGTDREDAPVNVNFDSYEAAKASASMGAREVYHGEMPPEGSTPVPSDIKEEFYAWALCGTPQ